VLTAAANGGGERTVADGATAAGAAEFSSQLLPFVCLHRCAVTTRLQQPQLGHRRWSTPSDV